MAYNVDLVLVIDGTGSMTPFLDKVKAHALSFHNDILEKMENIQKNLDSLRVKIIIFRDYYHDDEPMIISDFYKLIDKSEVSETESDKSASQAFKEFLDGIIAMGGGDEPESGLEGIALAIKSDWVQGENCRHIIAVWTDASCHPFVYDRKPHPVSYPKDMPKNLRELTGMWGQDMGMNSKRAILYTPNVEPWNTISETWDNTIHYPAKAGTGLNSTDYNSILEMIINSI